MLSREDLLRELELLPVWQLRNPMPPSTNPDTHVQEVANTLTTSTSIKSAVAAPEGEPVAVVLPYSFRLIISKDTQWAFVVGPHDEEAEQLLKNMLKAIAVTIDQDIADANIDNLGHYSPKMIVIMGENEAQQLLNKTQRIEQMRSTPHLLHDTPAIVTYSPSYLLSNLADKAKAWEDLCLAKFTISALKSDQ